ncbi:MAG: hydroxymethylglutaryl-CoA lyase [Bdellovibrionota bacterium]
MASDFVTIFEVGPRDGLQNEPIKLGIRARVDFINGLISAGIREIEVGAFVRPDVVPQMGGSDRILSAVIKCNPAKIHPWVLVPNRKGFDLALKAGATRIALFTAATDSFARKNIGMSVAQSLREYFYIVHEARKSNLKIRGYVSTAFGCPFEGAVKPRQSLRVIEKFADMGVDQISIGDTIGIATPLQIEALMRPAVAAFGASILAGHFHDTRGTALANVLRSLELGVRIFDSSAGGLGGCPFAPGASGNLATEDIVFMLNGMGIRSGVDLDRLCDVSVKLLRGMKRKPGSKFLQYYICSKK